MRIPIGLQTYPTGHTLTAERLINCYAEQAPATSRTPVFVKAVPGLKAMANVATEPVLSVCPVPWRDEVYTVVSGQLYRTTEGGVTTVVGSVGAGPYTWAPIRSSITVCDGQEAWNYNGTDFQQILPAAVSFDGFGSVAKSRQRVLFANTADDQWAWSEPTDARTIAGTNKRSAEGLDDPVRRLFTQLDEVFAFGDISLELFYDTGNTSDTFQRRGPSHISRGLGAPLSVASDDNSVFWLGDDRIVYRLDGLTPVRQSNHGIEASLQGKTVSDARAFFHTWDGHKFYTLILPSAGVCYVYDLNTQLWHERATRGAATWRAVGAVTLNDRVLIADNYDSRLLEMHGDVHEDAGVERLWTVQCAPIRDPDSRRTLFLDRLEVQFDPGQGAVMGKDRTPEVMLDWSDDGGKTWSSALIRAAGAGPRGQYGYRLVWHNLGQFVERTLRFRGSDAYPMRLYNVHAEIRPGRI